MVTSRAELKTDPVQKGYPETVQNLGVVALPRGRRAGESAMRWRVVIELTRDDGATHCHEVSTGNDDSSGSAVSPLGLTLADAKAVLAGMQRHLVQAQVADYCRDRRCCPHCQEQRPLKGIVTLTSSGDVGPGGRLRC